MGEIYQGPQEKNGPGSNSDSAKLGEKGRVVGGCKAGKLQEKKKGFFGGGPIGNQSRKTTIIKKPNRGADKPNPRKRGQKVLGGENPGAKDMLREID